jgi:hypothetical protein
MIVSSFHRGFRRRIQGNIMYVKKFLMYSDDFSYTDYLKGSSSFSGLNPAYMKNLNYVALSGSADCGEL